MNNIENIKSLRIGKLYKIKLNHGRVIWNKQFSNDKNQPANQISALSTNEIVILLKSIILTNEIDVQLIYNDKIGWIWTPIHDIEFNFEELT